MGDARVTTVANRTPFNTNQRQSRGSVDAGARKGQIQLFVHGGVQAHRRAGDADTGSGGHQAHCIGIDFSDIVRI